MHLTIGLLALLLAAPAAQQAKSTAAAKGADHTADEAALQKLTTDFVDAINKGDFKGAAATYDADGVYFSPDGEKHTGVNDIAEAFSHLAGIKVTLQVSNVHWVNLDVAVVQGTWQVSGQDVQPPDHGDYMAVIKKVGRGWKYAEVRPWVPAAM